MVKNIFEEFDGYGEVVEEREISRKYGTNYTAERHSPDQVINRLHPSWHRLP